jgi:hypothetical protein
VTRFDWDADLSIEVPDGWEVYEREGGLVQFVPPDESLGAVSFQVARRVTSGPPSSGEVEELVARFVSNLTKELPPIDISTSKDALIARTSVTNQDDPCWDVIARLNARRAVVLSYAFPCGPSPELDAARAVVATLLSGQEMALQRSTAEAADDVVQDG